MVLIFVWVLMTLVALRMLAASLRVREVGIGQLPTIEERGETTFKFDVTVGYTCANPKVAPGSSLVTGQMQFILQGSCKTAPEESIPPAALATARPEMSRSIEARVESFKGRLDLSVEANNPQYRIFARVELVAPDGKIFHPRYGDTVEFRAGSKNFGWGLVLPLDCPARFDVMVKPAPDLALGSSDTTPIWPETIVVRNLSLPTTRPASK